MKRQRVHLWVLSSGEELGTVLLLSLCFLLGAGAGAWCCGRTNPAGTNALRQWLDGYLAVAKTGQTQWLKLLWSAVRFPLLVTLLQWTALGVLLVPLTLGVRGFLFAYSVSLFVRTYAWRGLGAALLLFGPFGMVELTALFLLGTAAFLRARSIGTEKQCSGPTLLAWGLCWCGVLFGALVQVLLSGWTARTLAALLR